jgi:hypothetical protein
MNEMFRKLALQTLKGQNESAKRGEMKWLSSWLFIFHRF